MREGLKFELRDREIHASLSADGHKLRLLDGKMIFR